ncbi:protein kinase domain-containing protein [Streptomyces hirsutus]|uniref:protein kinase domain-containing protein n=1 Tax=Streptomyces hirsutus TaxID=35620 RepID=UPI003664EABF
MAPQRKAGAGAEAELPEYAGHYRLESLLGSGGMGVVHLARSTSGLKLAVKVVHAEFARDREFRGRFRQEVAAARRVSGAFTAPVVDADPEAERPWMATLFIPGPTLAEQVKRNGPMTPAQLRRLMTGLAEALRDIHRVGVVHRDLKPSNVLLAEDGPKVIDFGISRPTDSELRTETGKLIGTPPFMAPEQFRRPREVGPAADIFALGSVVVHAATGRGPFDSDSPYVVAYQVVHDEPDLTGIPEELATLVLRCLAKEPENRPTPDELMRELRSMAASYDTQAFIPAQRTGAEAAPAPSPRRPRRPSRKRLSRNVLLAGAALVLVASGAASVQLAGSEENSPAEVPVRTPSATFGAWEAEPVSGNGGMPHCSYGADELLCAQRDVAFALDPADGDLMWQRTTSDRAVSRPPVVSGGIVQSSMGEDGSVEGLDPASGAQVWQRDVPEGGSVRYVGDMLLLTGMDGTVTGVDSSSGATKWNRSLPGHSGTPLASFAADPLAYATSPSYDGSHTRVTAVDPGTGEPRWDVRMEGALQPIGVGGGSVFFLSGDPRDGTTTGLVRYSPKSGASLRVPLPVPRHDVRATVRGNVVHLLAQGGSLEAVDLKARKRVWHLETGISHGSAPVSDGRHVYVTAPDGRLLAVDARTGRLLGQTAPRLGAAADRVVASLPEPVVAGGRVYASAPDGTVFAVDGREPAGW